MRFRDRHNRGDAYIVLLSLVFSLLVWGITKLSDTYSSLYHYKVEISTNIPSREFTSLSLGPLAIRGSSSGFQLLNNRLDTRNNKNIVRIEVDKSLVRSSKQGGDSYFVLVDNIKGKLREKIDLQIDLDNFVTDTLFFEIKKSATAKVKVALKKNFSYKSEFMGVGEVALSPDSVVIQGNADVISTIDSLVTEVQIRNNIKDDIQGVAKLKPLKGVAFSTSEVYYSQRVERYYESNIEVPVQVVNLPSDKEVDLFPGMVTLVYRAAYNSKKILSADDFFIYVDYRTLGLPGGDDKKIITGDLPKGVIEAHTTRSFVDSYMIKDI